MPDCEICKKNKSHGIISVLYKTPTGGEHLIVEICEECWRLVKSVVSDVKIKK